jgi:hypothetical protein
MAGKYKFEITQLKFEVKEDGTILNGRVFFDATAWTKPKPKPSQMAKFGMKYE